MLSTAPPGYPNSVSTPCSINTFAKISAPVNLMVRPPFLSHCFKSRAKPRGLPRRAASRLVRLKASPALRLPACSKKALVSEKPETKAKKALCGTTPFAAKHGRSVCAAPKRRARPLPRGELQKPVFAGQSAMHRPYNGAEPSLAYTGTAALGQGCSGKTFTRALHRLAPPGGSLCAEPTRYSIPSLHVSFS